MMRESLVAPDLAAGRLLAFRPAPGVVLQGAVLVSAVNALLWGALTGGQGLALPLPQGDVLNLLPLAHAAMIFATLVLAAGAVQVGGAILGGRGRLSEALLLMVWLEVLAVAIELVLLVASLLLPALAPFLGVAGIGVLLWCTVNFTRALHGFAGLGRSIAALLLGGLLVGLGLSVLLGLLGFGGPADV
jgi:hypothetical protein